MNLMDIRAPRLVGLFLAAAILFTAFALLAPPVSAEGNITDVRFHVVGPMVVGTDKTNSYEISVIDSLVRDWKYEAWVEAKNETGAHPTEPDKVTGNLTGGNNTWAMDITATTFAGDMMLILNISSPSGEVWYKSEEKIIVVEPIVIKANIFNSGQVKINNATVDVFLDGEQIDTQTIDSLEPGMSTNVTANWISDDYEPGWHEARFVVDVNGDGLINPDMGDIIVTKRVYVRGTGGVTLLVLVGILAILVGMMLINRRMKKRR